VILVDTTVWIDHFRDGDALLVRLLERGEVLAHPWVTGELTLGHLRNRAETLKLLSHLPQATVATAAELLAFIERHKLFGLGIGYVDAQLIAATRLTDDARLWTRDRRLHTAAEGLSAAYTRQMEE
jgi:predicted nucleic acid-binding protein